MIDTTNMTVEEAHAFCEALAEARKRNRDIDAELKAHDNFVNRKLTNTWDAINHLSYILDDLRGDKWCCNREDTRKRITYWLCELSGQGELWEHLYQRYCKGHHDGCGYNDDIYIPENQIDILEGTLEEISQIVPDLFIDWNLNSIAIEEGHGDLMTAMLDIINTPRISIRDDYKKLELPTDDLGDVIVICGNSFLDCLIDALEEL